MMESSFVLLIFFFLLALVVIFFMIMQKAAVKDKNLEYANLQLIKKSQIINYLPEILCTEDNHPKPDCFDIEKLDALSNISSQARYKQYYLSMFGNMNINISMYNSDSKTWSKPWTIYSNPGNGTRRQIQIPISLFNASANQNDARYFGVIFLDVYT
jgi:hypothetical protein